MGNWKIETGLYAHVNFGLLPEEVFFFFLQGGQKWCLICLQRLS